MSPLAITIATHGSAGALMLIFLGGMLIMAGGFACALLMRRRG